MKMNEFKSGFQQATAASIAFFATVCIATPALGGLPENTTAPLNYFLYSFGPASLPSMHLGWVFTALLLVILFIISLLLVLALFRKRPVEDSFIIGGEDAGERWIYIGTGVSTCILFVLALYTLMTLNAIAKPARTPLLTLTVTGYDWWWKIEYEDDDPAKRFVTANEMHIPIGIPVLVKLKSADVIHAFWAPLLAGKTQMIPGLTNQQWLQADAEGVYRGQCTQYCGAQHAHMGFEVVAENAAEFGKWQDAQRKDAVMKAGSETKNGWKIFQDRCAGCHAIRGTEAAGAHAPDLTHLNSRRLIAAGLLTNSPDNQLKWIAHAQEYKPGSRMPNMELTAAESAVLSAFLSTLD